jgi:hypothetical protein
VTELLLAHGVGRVYESPLPVWLYAVGAAATVVASFVIRAVARDELRSRTPRLLAGPGVARVYALVLKILAIVGLVGMVVSGAVVRGQGLFLAPLLFWVALIVGVSALSALVAGSWDAANPWTSIESVYRLRGPEATATPPWWIGPLLVFALFWFELISGVGFESTMIAGVVIGYSAYVFALRARFAAAWPHADPLAIIFRFAGMSAPLELRADGIFYKGPVRDLDRDESMPLPLFASLFVLLGATTLDNVRETTGWHSLLESARVDEISPLIIDTLALLVFALAFLGAFALALVTAGRWMRGATLGNLAARFAWSLVPIAVVYLLAHNAPLLMTGVPSLLRELSDPFARGWNLLGTAELLEGYVPSPALVWALEILLIVGGHIVGVLVAHRIAVRASESHGAAVRSQLALTALMSVFTITTLWLLSQPLIA